VGKGGGVAAFARVPAGIAAVLLLSMIAGCGRVHSTQPGGFVGAWEGRKETLVVHRNGLAEGKLFGAPGSQSFTWRTDGDAIKLTFGQVASDTVEYRATIDDAGHLVVDSDAGRCVLSAVAPERK